MSKAHLCFQNGGGRTYLHQQFVPYPFHLTRPLYLDRPRPDLATVLLQSSSGGLYSADDLHLDIVMGPDTAANITTQSSTVVHDSRAQWSVYNTTVHVGPRSFLALTPDPAILLPGARFANTVDVTVSDGAVGVVLDGYLVHDPNGGSETFQHLLIRTRLHDSGGCLLSSDQQEVDGGSFADAMGGLNYLGNAVIFGDIAESIEFADLELKLKSVDCVAGASRLPNDAGVGVRILAADGAAFRGGQEIIVTTVFQHALGILATPRHR